MSCIEPLKIYITNHAIPESQLNVQSRADPLSNRLSALLPDIIQLKCQTAESMICSREKLLHQTSTRQPWRHAFVTIPRRRYEQVVATLCYEQS